MFDNDWVITTRINNDDCVAPTFIESIKNKFNNKTKIVDSKGCQYDSINNKWYSYHKTSPNSPFLSLIEKVSETNEYPVRTCYYRKHIDMIKYFQYEWIDKILYCQIIHDNNIMNKIVGDEIEPCN